MIETELLQMIERLGHEILARDSQSPNWKSLWAQVRQINEDFKNTQFAEQNGRQIAWTQFQTTISDLKRAQQKDQENWQRRKEQSVTHLHEIQSLASEAADNNSDLYNVLFTVALGGMNLLIEEGLDAIFGKSDKQKEALDHRSKVLKNGWNYLSAHKSDMLGMDKGAAFEALTDAKEKLDRAWERWKEERNELFEEKQRNWQRKRDHFEEKQQAWREGQERFIEHLEENESKMEAALSKREDHLSKLKSDYEDAWSDSFRERVDGWIDEEKANISALEEKLSSIREKIREVKAKLYSSR